MGDDEMYDDEIPRKLEVGKEYSGEQLSFFMNAHKDGFILTDVQEPFFNSKNKLRITRVLDGYLNNVECKGATVKNKIYIATKI
jgi:hypothetical protein